MKTILNVASLEKSYNGTKAVKGISFGVQEGEILCLLGPNGAGKSTTINTLTTALSYDSGTIEYKGADIRSNEKQYKKSLGIVPQDIAIYEDVSAVENVRFFASLYGLKREELSRRVNIALEMVGLLERQKEKPKTFSGGMKRRLNIACAIAHQPELLIMDEPTLGIDAQSRNHILNSIKRLRDSGMTVLYTTHYMEEVEEISTRIIIIDKGSIIATGTKEELKMSLVNERRFVLHLDYPQAVNHDKLYGVEGVKEVIATDEGLVISSVKGVENLDRIISIIIDAEAGINNITCQTPNLETAFLELTGRSLRD